MLPASVRPLAWPAASVLPSQRSSPPRRPAPPSTPAPRFRTQFPLLQFWACGLASLLRPLAAAAAACDPPCRWRSAAALASARRRWAPCIPANVHAHAASAGFPSPWRVRLPLYCLLPSTPPVAFPRSPSRAPPPPRAALPDTPAALFRLLPTQCDVLAPSP